MNRANAHRVVAELLMGVDVRDDTVPGRSGAIPIRYYSSATATATLGTVVWLHGGAFSHGGLDQLESHAVAAALARSGASVVTVDYRRVPPWNPMRTVEPRLLDGTRYPVPVDDVTDVMERIIDAREGPVTLGGASAGACLSAAATLRAVRREGPRADRLVLAYGTFHADLPPVSEDLRARVRGFRGVAQFRR